MSWDDKGWTEAAREYHAAGQAKMAATSSIAVLQVQTKPRPSSEDPAGKAKRVAVLVRGDQVPLKSVQWAWKHRFAFGKLALIAGDPGLGKSQIGLDIVARHTISDFWPVDGGRAQVAEAIVLTAEDGLSDTVAPRLVAAGADMEKVHFLKGTKVEGGDEELFDLTRDVEALREVLAQNPAIKIIVIDPVTAYLGETQAQRNAQVRKALAPLVRLIEDTGVLVIGITHLNKSQGKAIYRVLDSIAFVALGRILHLVIADAETPGNCKFICDKTNIGPKPPGLTYICQQVPVVTEDGEEWVSRICWGTSHINETADQAMSTETTSAAEGTTAKDDWIEFLRKVLANGPAKAVGADGPGGRHAR
jgi:putative DNA primase/helicase